MIRKNLTACLSLACAIAFSPSLVLANTPAAAQSKNNNKLIYAYYTNWDAYAAHNYKTSDIPVDNIDVALYAFAEVGDCARPYATDANPTLCTKKGDFTGVQDYKLHSSDPWSDFNAEGGLGNAGKLINTMHTNGKKAVLSIGGVSLSVPIKTAINDEHRDAFAKSIVDFLAKVKKDNKGQGFDGVDIDWEPDSNQWSGETNTDLSNYQKFIDVLTTDLNTYFGGRHNYLLTAALPASPDVLKHVNSVYAGFWSTLADKLDSMDIMSYDYHGTFDNPAYTNFNAPLHFDPNQPSSTTGREDFNVESTVKAYLDQGVPANKIIVGIPAYGRMMRGVNAGTPPGLPGATGLYQTFDPSADNPGEYDNTGVFDYQYIVSKLIGEGKPFADYRINAVSESAAYSKDKNGSWISFDSTQDVRDKADFIKDNNLGGAMLWSLSGDLKKSDPNYQQASLSANIADELAK